MGENDLILWHLAKENNIAFILRPYTFQILHLKSNYEIYGTHSFTEQPTQQIFVAQE